jgi:hypothetical protein
VGNSKGKPDAGQGGKLGHSNQDHWEYTEEIKLAAKKRRRHHAKKQSVEGLKEYLKEKEPPATNTRTDL